MYIVQTHIQTFRENTELNRIMVGAGTQLDMISYMYIVPELQAGNIHTGWNTHRPGIS